ncbi:MAG: RNA polymerase sigma factor [Ilumatobacteraceae bacterium]
MGDSRRWAVGTRDELLACYHATLPEVYRYAAQLCGDRQRAEDVVHDVYLGLLQRSRAGDVDAVGVGWLCRALRHRYLDALRAERRDDQRVRLVSAPPVAAGDGDVADLLVALPARERAVIVLRYVDDLPVAEVAKQLGMTVRASESLLQRAKARARRNAGTEVGDA